MMLAFELKQPLEYVMNMDPEEFVDWVAFVKYKGEQTEKAVQSARRKNR